PSHGRARPGDSSADIVMRIRVDGRGNVQAGDAIANLSQADTEPRGRGRPVEAGFTQRAYEDVAFLLVEPCLQIVGQWHAATRAIGSRRLNIWKQVPMFWSGC